MKKIKGLGQNTEFPVQFINSDNEISAVYTTTQIEDNELKSDIFIDEVSITNQSADYDQLKSIHYNKEIWTVYTEYKNGNKRIVLNCYKSGSKTKVYPLSDFGKYDNPDIIEYDGKIYVTWEDYTNKNCMIASTIIDISNIDDTVFQIDNITIEKENAYKPKFGVDDNALYLFYESFYQKRYHLMVRCLLKNNKFGNPVEIGFDTCNDMDVSVCTHQGKILVVWENSSPLYTDYKWIDHEGGVVSMPSFGHGWRVDTKLGFRRLSYVDNNLIIENLGSDSTWNAPIDAMEEESSGMPKVFVDKDDNIILAYVSRGQKNWDANIKYFYHDKWVLVNDIDVSYYGRIQPSVAITRNSLIFAGEINDANEKAILEYEMPQILNNDMDKFTVVKKIPYNRVTDAPGYVREPEYKTTYDDKELSLFWGDLHMHSNISRCSLHPKFHCTEASDKQRFSKDVGGLDFSLLTDHESMNDREWIDTVKAAQFNNQDNGFISFVGFEWTSSQQKHVHNYGHYNVLYKDEGPLMRVSDPDYDSIEKVWNRLQENQALTIPHHPGEKIHPLDWDYFNSKFEPLVEIYQVRGSYEHDECEMHPENYGRAIQYNNSVQYGLNKGYRFGFTSGGEHEGVGITAVYAEELTRESIFEALKKRQVYGTTSEKIILDFRIDGHMMGSEIKKVNNENDFVCDIFVRGTDTIEYIELVQSDKTTTLYTSDNNDNEIRLSVNQKIDKDSDWYYIRVKQKDLNMAWSSPIWIDRK